MITDMMIDTINGDVDSIPAISRQATAIAYYVTGSPSIQWTPQHIAFFPISSHIRIDQSADLDKFVTGNADVADIENGAGTIASFINAAKERASRDWPSPAYISAESLSSLHNAASNFSLLTRVQYWIANWNLNQQEAILLLSSNDSIVAVQFASPSSNPHTFLPGTTVLTLAQANCDLSVKRADWFPCPYPSAIAWRE